MKSHQLINQDSGIVEYYTPAFIVDYARVCMGGIDLDPASSAQANKTINAGCFFSEDALSKEWHGRVWMNHPFQRGENHKWINKLVAEFESGRVTQACCISYASTSERWFQPLLKRPQCYLFPRTNYLLPDGTIKKGVTKGSVVTYFGTETARFRSAFSNIGTVKL